MTTLNGASKDVDAYISSFPEDIQKVLEKLRKMIREAAPEAEETIHYQLPTFMLRGYLVHFAAFNEYIVFYPTASGTEKFKEELSAYEGASGSVIFPLDKPIPFDLIKEIVAFRVLENVFKEK